MTALESRAAEARKKYNRLFQQVEKARLSCIALEYKVQKQKAKKTKG